MRISLIVVLSVLLAIFACKGERGPAGLDGQDGQGTPGTPGLDGKNSPQVIEGVTICPSVPGAFPETILRVDSTLFAVYYQGTSIHLAELVQGTYVTTDGRNVVFTVNADSTLTCN